MTEPKPQVAPMLRQEPTNETELVSQVSISLDLADVMGLIAAVAAIIAALFTYPAWAEWRKRQWLGNRFGADLFGWDTIRRYTRYYVTPDCSPVDPSNESEIRHVVATRWNVNRVLDRFLSDEHAERHLLMLADSGMGKTSLLLNYYYRNARRWSGRHRIAVIPLGIPDASARIAEIDDHPNTVLFLDALDEDARAIKDHRGRIDELMHQCRSFRRIVITCRTQFFPSSEEIPSETGVIRVAPRSLNEQAVYTFRKLYLMPLTDQQVRRVLAKRYAFPRLLARRKAKKLVFSVPLLSVRPMLLSALPELLQEEVPVNTRGQLYRAMVEGWLRRESSWVSMEALRSFSEQLAVDLIVNRAERKAERIPLLDLIRLAEEWRMPLEGWQLTGRSLLNRDAEGNYKFAHRSIMEYLFVRAHRPGNRDLDSAVHYGLALRTIDEAWSTDGPVDGFTDEMRLLVEEEARIPPNQLDSGIATALEDLARRKLGALIAVERHISLEEFVATGMPLDLPCTGTVILMLLAPFSPFSDGALIVRGRRIRAAGAILPDTQFPARHRSLGLRHRAAHGLSEQTDAEVVVVSEESGAISLASRGKLRQNLNPEEIAGVFLRDLDRRSMPSSSSSTRNLPGQTLA